MQVAFNASPFSVSICAPNSLLDIYLLRSDDMNPLRVIYASAFATNVPRMRDS
jgi:hypothetical protein